MEIGLGVVDTAVKVQSYLPETPPLSSVLASVVELRFDVELKVDVEGGLWPMDVNVKLDVWCLVVDAVVANINMIHCVNEGIIATWRCLV